MAAHGAGLWGLFGGKWRRIPCGFEPIGVASFKSVHVLASDGTVYTCPASEAVGAHDIAAALRPEQVRRDHPRQDQLVGPDGACPAANGGRHRHLRREEACDPHRRAWSAVLLGELLPRVCRRERTLPRLSVHSRHRRPGAGGWASENQARSRWGPIDPPCVSPSSARSAWSRCHAASTSRPPARTRATSTPGATTPAGSWASETRPPAFTPPRSPSLAAQSALRRCLAVRHSAHWAAAAPPRGARSRA